MRLIYWYLRIAYFLGFKAHAYNHISAAFLPDAWAKRCYDEAWEYQKVLIANGWYKCPSCFWATKEHNGHIIKGDGYCYEQAQNDHLYDMAMREYLHHGSNARPIQ